MEVGDGCEDVSWAAVKEISDKLEVGNGEPAEENDSFGSPQSEAFNIACQSPEVTSLNGEEVRKEAGKVVEALIMSFEEDKLEHELASSSHRLEQLISNEQAEVVMRGNEEGEVLIAEDTSSDKWYSTPANNEAAEEDNYTSFQNTNCENECQSKMEGDINSGNHPKKASLLMEKPDQFRPNSFDVGLRSTNPVNINKSLPASSAETERLSTLDQYIIHGNECNREALPDPLLLDILEVLPHSDSRDEMKALVDTVSNMEKTEVRADTLIIMGWGETDGGRKENFEASTEKGLFEAGFLTISPLACASAGSADSIGNISEAEQGFSKSVSALEPEKIGAELDLQNPVNEPGCSGEEYEYLQSELMGPVKAWGESQLGDAWRPTAGEANACRTDRQPAAAAALADSNAHSAHRGQHAVNCVDVGFKMDAEREGKVDGGELKEWLLVKEKEFDEILGHGKENDHNAKEMDGRISKDGFVKACEIEVMACEVSQTDTLTDLRPGAKDISSEVSAASTFITETTTDLMDELELQSEILRQITEKATVVSADNVVGETIKEYEEHDGEIQMKQGKTSKVGPKSMKAKKKIPKSPLLKRSEIKACIDLHNACENADILQEIIHPAICFGSSHEAAHALEQDSTNKELESKTMSKGDVDEPAFVEEVTWQDPPQPRPRKPAVAAHFSTPGMAWFPWKTLSLLLLIGTAAIINLDMNRSGGSFKASNTGQFLSDLGQYERVMGAGTWIMVSTKQGRQWVEVTLPPYLAHGRKVTGPYLELVAAKANEAGTIAKLGLERVREASKLGLARLEAALPGLGVRLEMFGTEASRLGVLAVTKGKEVATNAREGLALLLSGKVDWAAVRIQISEAVEVAQMQLLAAANYVQLQLKQLVK